MTNYYSELKFSPDSSVEEIKVELLRLEQVWRKREINSPETATAKLALINEAKKVFSSSSSKAAYDRELEQSRRKPVAYDPKQERYAQWRKWYDAALSYMKTEQWDLAKTAIEKALSYADPDNEDAMFYNDVATIYRENKEFALAINYVNKAIVLEPETAELYLTKGLIFGSEYEAADYTTKRQRGEKLVSDERGSLKRAIQLTNNSKTKGIALGCLSWSYYRRIQTMEMYYGNPDNGLPEDVEIARQYAEEAILTGDPWGIGLNIFKKIEVLCQLRKNRLEERRKREEKEQLERLQREKVRKENEERYNQIRIKAAEVAEAERLQKQKEAEAERLREIKKRKEIQKQTEEKRRKEQRARIWSFLISIALIILGNYLLLATRSLISLVIALAGAVILLIRSNIESLDGLCLFSGCLGAFDLIVYIFFVLQK